MSLNLIGLIALVAGVFLIFAAPGVFRLSKSQETNEVMARRFAPAVRILGAIIAAYGVARLLGFLSAD